MLPKRRQIWLGARAPLIKRFIGVNAWMLRDMCFGIELFALMPAITLDIGVAAITIGFIPMEELHG